MAKGTINDWLLGDLVDSGGKQALVLSTKLTDATGTAIGTAGSPLVVNGGTGASANQVQGAQANGVATTVNPVLTGGYASTAAPAAVTAGQLQRPWLGLNGQAVTSLNTVSSPLLDSQANTILGPCDVAGATFVRHIVRQEVCNGNTWDRHRKANVFKRVASSAASGNPDFLKASAGDVMLFWGLCGATAAYLQIYNKATAPVIGTDTPILTYPLIANAAFSQTIPNGGAYFGTGIAFAFTTDAAGTTASAAAAVTSFSLLGA